VLEGWGGGIRDGGEEWKDGRMGGREDGRDIERWKIGSNK
jgi:hypothetical protein